MMVGQLLRRKRRFDFEITNDLIPKEKTKIVKMNRFARFSGK